MAKVNQVAMCPNPLCQKELPHPTPDSCPHCGKILHAESGTFGPPDYISMQLRANRERNGISSEKGPNDVQKKELDKIDSDLVKWLRSCPDEDRIAAFEDAYLFLGQILHADVDGEQIRLIVGQAKRLGKLAEAIEGYIKSGGILRVRETRQIQAEP